MGQAAAQRAVDDLCKIQLGHMKKTPIYLVKKVTDEMEGLPHGPGDRSKIRYLLSDMDSPEEERVWIGANLVDGFRAFKQPLKRLKSMGDIPARLLVYLYQFEAMEEFGGLHPWKTIYQTAETTSRGYGQGWFGYELLEAEVGTSSVYLTVMEAVTGGSTEENKNHFWTALNKLDRAGFIYRMISVMDRGTADPDGQVLFELGIKSHNDYQPPKGEEGVARQTADIAGSLGVSVTDAAGRIRNTFAVIVPGGSEAHVIGIYRMRFRVSNPNNMGIKGAWARIHRGNAEAMEWLHDLAERVNQSRDPEDAISFPWIKKVGNVYPINGGNDEVEQPF